MSQQQLANLNLALTVKTSQIAGLELAKRQAIEQLNIAMNQRLSKEEMATLIFDKLADHIAEFDKEKSKHYVAVLQATMLVMDQVILATTDDTAKAMLVEAVRNLHLTVRA